MTTLISMWFCWRNVWPISFAESVYCIAWGGWFEEIKLQFWWYCDVLETRFGDCQRQWRMNWLPRRAECEIGASYGRIACRSDFVLLASFCSVAYMSCRCFEGNHSFAFALRQISRQTIMCSTAKFLAKFLLTTSKASVLHLYDTE